MHCRFLRTLWIRMDNGVRFGVRVTGRAPTLEGVSRLMKLHQFRPICVWAFSVTLFNWQWSVGLEVMKVCPIRKAKRSLFYLTIYITITIDLDKNIVFLGVEVEVPRRMVRSDWTIFMSLSAFSFFTDPRLPPVGGER